MDGELSRNTVALMAWLASTGFSVDVRGLRRRFPEIGWHTLEQWGASRNWTPSLA
jgi:hypothetical protein